MVAFARNLSGTNKTRGPKVQQRQQKPKQTTAQRNPLDRGVRISTRELKLHINILDASLANPGVFAKMSEKEREAARKRLSFYRRELEKRDARDNRPLSGTELTQKFVQAAHRGRENGLRVQHA